MSASSVSFLKLVKRNLLIIDWRGRIMWDWQMLCFVSSTSGPVKRAGTKASTKTIPSQLFLWKNGFCNEGISNFSWILWPACQPHSSANEKFAHSRLTFLSTSVGRHGYHRIKIFLSHMWSLYVFQSSSLLKTVCYFSCLVEALVLMEKYFHAPFQVPAVSCI